MSKNKKAVNVSDIKDDNAIVAQQKNDIKISENLEERNAIIEKIKNIKDDKRVILKITTDDLKLKKIKKKKEKKQKIVNPNWSISELWMKIFIGFFISILMISLLVAIIIAVVWTLSNPIPSPYYVITMYEII